jgi:UDP-N-acetylglucosamine--N-acetylmuramyl-(pentapeptide) pyrophosphoryl-undecaprenol N-acetylglucosamine transferase
MTKTILLAAGGTGGHIFPAKALADILKKRGHNPILITDERFKNYGLADGSIEYKIIPVVQISGSISNKIKGAISLVKSFFITRKLIKELSVSCVVGFGGYPSFPVVMAGILSGCKTVIHEQNSLMGRANEALAKRVDAIATSFAEMFEVDEKIKGKIIQTGNPVRQQIKSIRELPYPEFNENSSLHILVTGGSQGANVFSKIVPAAIKLLPAEYRARIRIDQQARQETIDEVRKTYNELGVNAEVAPFFKDIPTRLASSHLVISRSGASTLSEVVVAGRPIIMVPFPRAKDNHQMLNANAFEELEIGWVTPEESFTAEALAFKLGNFFKLPNMLIDSAKNSYKAGESFAKADENLADLVENLI